MSRLDNTNLYLVRGDTGRWTTILTEPESGDTFALTGCSFRLTFWASVPGADITTDATAALVLTSPSGGLTVTDADNGEITIVMTKTQSAQLTAELYRFDLQLTNPSGEEYTVARGQLNVDPQFTHTTS